MSDFELALTRKFDDTTYRKTSNFFEMTGMPAPDSFEQFLSATAGFIVFNTMAGLVIRVEVKHYDTAVVSDRVSHPLVLQPLGSIDLGNTVIEVCPATRLGAQLDDCKDIDFNLREDGFELDDHQAANLGYLPNGQLVVIDRPAVVQLSHDCASAQELLEKYGDPQSFYNSLRKSFRRGLAAGDLRGFMQDAVHAKERGLLVPGWEQDNHLHDMSLAHNKTPEAKLKADNYTTRIIRHFQR